MLDKSIKTKFYIVHEYEKRFIDYHTALTLIPNLHQRIEKMSKNNSISFDVPEKLSYKLLIVNSDYNEQLFCLYCLVAFKNKGTKFKKWYGVFNFINKSMCSKLEKLYETPFKIKLFLKDRDDNED